MHFSMLIDGLEESVRDTDCSLDSTDRLHLLLHRNVQEDELRLSEGDCVMISDVISM